MYTMGSEEALAVAVPAMRSPHKAADVDSVVPRVRKSLGPATERRSPTTPAAFGWSRTPTEPVRPNASTGSCTGAGMVAGLSGWDLL